MAGVDRQINQRAGFGIVHKWQIQREAEQDRRIISIQRHDQLRLARLRAVHAVQIAMHLEAHHVLIQLIQRIAGLQRDRADVAEIIHHHLQHLAFQRFRRRGVEVGEGEHGGAPGRYGKWRHCTGRRATGQVKRHGDQGYGILPAAMSRLRLAFSSSVCVAQVLA